MTSLLDVIAPKPTEEGTESVVREWLKEVGDSVKKHDPLLEIETDKATVEIPSPFDGILTKILKFNDDKIELNDVLCQIEVKEHQTEVSPIIDNSTSRDASPTKDSASQIRLSPAVKHLVKENSVDILKIKGTGQGGRIVYQDVEKYLQNQEIENTALTQKSRKISHSPMRLSIANHMVDSLLETAPHVTAVFNLDLSSVIKHRDQHKDLFKEKGIHLSFTSYFILATVNAIQAVPEVNSRWHEDALEIFDDCNIGIATAIDHGLVVPVIKQAQSLNLSEIAQVLQKLTEKARSKKMGKEEFEGGTFTISNHGVSGSIFATPIIINQPQSAILGVGKVEKRVVVTEIDGEDKMEIKPMAYVTLTIDHRALDGFQANTYLSKFVEVLENLNVGQQSDFL